MPRRMTSARSYLLTYQDYGDIRRAPEVRNACPIISRGDLHEVSEFSNGSGEVLGTEAQLNEISFLPLQEGRWLNNLDGAQRRNVVVLGNQLAKVLFPGRPALGAFILINGLRFEVVGSMVSTKCIFIAVRRFSGTSARSFSLSFGRITSNNPAR